jgi:hypothetical protein
MPRSAKQVGWPFPTKASVLPCHCETFIRADLRAFRDVDSSPFDSLSLFVCLCLCIRVYVCTRFRHFLRTSFDEFISISINKMGSETERHKF